MARKRKRNWSPEVAPASTVARVELKQGTRGAESVQRMEAGRRKLLDQVRDAAAEIEFAQEALRVQVAAARAAGWSWREIGEALGTSASAAHQRFTRRAQ